MELDTIIDLSEEQQVKLKYIHNIGAESIVTTNITFDNGDTYQCMIRPSIKKMLILYKIEGTEIVPKVDPFLLFAFMLTNKTEKGQIESQSVTMQQAYDTALISGLKDFMDEEESRNENKN